MKKICAKTKNAFTLIEITLALGVVGVGVVSIMALFPAASSASRDAIGYTHAADSADNFLQVIKNQAHADWTFLGNIPSSTGKATDTTTHDPPTDNTNAISGSRGTVHDLDDPGGGLYQVLSYVDEDDDGVRDADEVVDFNGVVSVWKTDSPAAPGNQDIAVLLKAEVSWPAQAPYDGREKELYVLELFNR